MTPLRFILFLLLFAGSFVGNMACADQQSINSAVTAHTTASTLTTPQEADDIIGIWEVNNDYYTAVYEIEKLDDTYVGKVHYFNDGQTEYTGKNQKEDYFLDGITFADDTYKNGKMHLPDGRFYYVNFKLQGNKLRVSMAVDSQPYTEVWQRKSYE